MTRRRLGLRLTALLCVVVGALLAPGTPGRRAAAAEAQPPEGFAPWSEATFARARRERRILLVMVSTSWCHWCHVMKRETYGDPRVQTMLRRRFLPIYVDADARPDLAERFRRYRWPATGFLTSDGTPILALRGYRAPGPFLGILADVERRVRGGGPFPGFDDPNADGGPVQRASGLDPLLRRLEAQLDRAWDARMAGWGRPQKYPIPEPILDGLFMGFVTASPFQVGRDRALATLASEEQLIDPVAGGMYQYSLEGRWDRWHPEKIVPVNAGALAGYAEAHALTGQARWRRAGERILQWLRDTLRQPDGAFGVSQDADAPGLMGERYHRLDAAGRAPHGIPRVDASVYASENGQIAEALCTWYAATGDATALTMARAAVDRVLRTHRDEAGERLTHSAGAGSERLFLLDYADLGMALVALARVLPEGEAARYRAAARALASGMDRHLGDPVAGGWIDATVDPGDVGVFARPSVSLHGVARAVRFRVMLGGTQDERSRWQAALLHAADERAIQEHGPYVGGALRAARALEAAAAPEAHVAFGVGGERGEALRREALGWALRHPQVRLDPTPLSGPAATVCAGEACLPVADVAELRAALAESLR